MFLEVIAWLCYAQGRTSALGGCGAVEGWSGSASAEHPRPTVDTSGSSQRKCPAPPSPQ